MFVEFGLKLTQSSLLLAKFMSPKHDLLTIFVIDNRILDRYTGAPICVPTVSILGRIGTHASSVDVDVVKDNISGIGNEW